MKFVGSKAFLGSNLSLIVGLVIVFISGLAVAKASDQNEARVNVDFGSSTNPAIGAMHPENVIDFHDRSANITASFTESASDVVWTVSSSSVFSISVFVGPAVRLSNVIIDIFNVTCYNLPNLEDSSKPLSVPACVSIISESSNSQLSDFRLRFRSSFSNATLFSANLMASMENTKISVTDMPLVYARHVENSNEEEYSVPAIVLDAPYTRTSNIGSGNEFIFSRISAKFATLKKRPREFNTPITLMSLQYTAGGEANLPAPPAFLISNFTNLDADAGSNVNYNSLMIVGAYISFSQTHRCVLTVTKFTDMGFRTSGFLHTDSLVYISGFKTSAPVPLAYTGSKDMVHASVIESMTHVSSSARLVITDNDFTIGGGNVKVGYPHGRYTASRGGVILIRNNTGGQSANISSGISINMVFNYGGQGYITDNTNFGTIDMYSDLALTSRSSLTVSRNIGVNLIVVRGLLFYFDPKNGGTPIDPASLSNEAASTLLIEANEVKSISVTSLDTTYGLIQLQNNVPPLSNNNGSDPTDSLLLDHRYPIDIDARGGGVVSDLSNKGFTPNVVLRDFTGHYELWCANCSSSVMPNTTNTAHKSSAPTNDDLSSVKNATVTLVDRTPSSSSSFPLLPQRIQISWNAAPVFIVAPLMNSINGHKHGDGDMVKAIAKITDFGCSVVSLIDSDDMTSRSFSNEVSLTHLNASVSCAPSSTLRRCDKDYWFFKANNPSSHPNYRDEFVMREGVESCGEHQKDVPSGDPKDDEDDDKKDKWVISVAIAGAVIGVVIVAFIVKKVRSQSKTDAADPAELGINANSGLLFSKPIQRYD